MAIRRFSVDGSTRSQIRMIPTTANETPDASEGAGVSLHSACISPSPDDICGLAAAMVRQDRTAASMASPPA
jgi:hypothetical protein